MHNKAQKKAEPAVQELRALTMFADVPPRHISFPVANQYAMPHLKPGEFAIVDTTDRAPQHGELYVIEYSHPLGPYRQIVQVRNCRKGVCGRPRWMVGDLVRLKTAKEIDRALAARVPLRCSDGPYETDYLTTKLVGRIVGVLSPLPALA